MKDPQPCVTVYVCRAKSCTRRGAAEVAAGLEATFAREGVDAAVMRHDCFDLCQGACNVLLAVPGTEQRLYTRLHPRQAEKLAESVAREFGVGQDV